MVEYLNLKFVNQKLMKECNKFLYIMHDRQEYEYLIGPQLPGVVVKGVYMYIDEVHFCF